MLGLLVTVVNHSVVSNSVVSYCMVSYAMVSYAMVGDTMVGNMMNCWGWGIRGIGEVGQCQGKKGHQAESLEL